MTGTSQWTYRPGPRGLKQSPSAKPAGAAWCPAQPPSASAGRSGSAAACPSPQAPPPGCPSAHTKPHESSLLALSSDLLFHLFLFLFFSLFLPSSISLHMFAQWQGTSYAVSSFASLMILIVIMHTCRVPHLEMSPKCFTVVTK